MKCDLNLKGKSEVSDSRAQAQDMSLTFGLHNINGQDSQVPATERMLCQPVLFC